MAESGRKTRTRKLESRTALGGAIDASSRRREQEMLANIVEFADQVVVIVEKLQEVVRGFVSERYGELEQAAWEMDQLESTLDDAKQAILDRLGRGTVFPRGRADLAALVSSVDGIANLAAGAADRISMRRFSVPEATNKLMVELAEKDLEATRVLRDAVAAMGTDLREAINLARCVDRIESEADDIFAELYQAMFELDTDFKTFHQFKAIIERLENIADRCCQNAALIRHMALEYLENH